MYVYMYASESKADHAVQGLGDIVAQYGNLDCRLVFPVGFRLCPFLAWLGLKCSSCSSTTKTLSSSAPLLAADVPRPPHDHHPPSL